MPSNKPKPKEMNNMGFLINELIGSLTNDILGTDNHDDEIRSVTTTNKDGSRNTQMKCPYCFHFWNLLINSGNIVTNDICPGCGRIIDIEDINTYITKSHALDNICIQYNKSNTGNKYTDESINKQRRSQAIRKRDEKERKKFLRKKGEEEYTEQTRRRKVLIEQLGLSDDCALPNAQLEMKLSDKLSKEHLIKMKAMERDKAANPPEPISEERKEMIDSKIRQQNLKNLGLSPNSSISNRKLDELEMERTLSIVNGNKIVKKKGFLNKLMGK